MESAPPSAPPSEPRPMLKKPPGYRDPNTAGKPTPPPRKPILPPAFKPKPRRRGCCRICCCTCCIIFVLILLALVAITALAYVFYSPSLPEFHLVSFNVTKFNVTDNAADGTAYLDADTVARVEVKNSNKRMAWYLEETKVDVSADNGNLNLGSSNVGDLGVRAKEVAELRIQTKVREEVLDERQRKRVKSMVQSKGLVPNVEVQSRAGIGLQGWKSGKIGVTLECGGFVTMKHLQNGDNAPKCTVTLLKWIKIR